jgi:hypothetical protein
VYRAGFLDTAQVLPVAGTNPWSVPLPGDGGASPFSLNLELFMAPRDRVAILQQRAGAVAGQHELLVQQVVAWAQAARVARLLVLSAADAISLSAAPASPADRLAFVDSAEGQAAAPEGSIPAALAALGAQAWKPLAERASAGGRPVAPELPSPLPAAAAPATVAAEWQPPSAAAVAATTRAFADVFGAGYTPVYFRRALTAGLPCTALLFFTSEGDNTQDAALLALAAAKGAGLVSILAPPAAGAAAGGKGAPVAAALAGPPLPGGLIAPAYWSTLFGGAVDQSLFW